MNPSRLRCSLALVLTIAVGHVQAAIMSLKAVAVNGVPLPEPTNLVQAEPGDLIEAEIFISDWGELCFVRLYETTILGEAGSKSGRRGTVVPPSACCVKYPNPNEWPIRLCPKVDTSRPDWIHFGLATFTAVDTSTLDVGYFSTTLAEASCRSSYKAYAGTVYLAASDDACGTFTFDLSSYSILRGQTDDQIEVTPATEALEIDVRCLPRITAACPDNCATDPGYPHDPFDIFDTTGWDHVNLRFDGVDVGTLSCTDFSTRVEGGPVRSTVPS